MTPYEIERPTERERGIRLRCPEHDEEVELQPGHSGGVLYCPGCGIEIEISLHDDLDWRDWGERC